MRRDSCCVTLYTGISCGLLIWNKAGFVNSRYITTWFLITKYFLKHMRDEWKKTSLKYLFGNVARCFAIISKPWIAPSTGMASKFDFSFNIMHLRAPFPPATIIPGGPLRESTFKDKTFHYITVACDRVKFITQPGNGS